MEQLVRYNFQQIKINDKQTVVSTAMINDKIDLVNFTLFYYAGKVEIYKLTETFRKDHFSL